MRDRLHPYRFFVTFGAFVLLTTWNVNAQPPESAAVESAAESSATESQAAPALSPLAVEIHRANVQLEAAKAAAAAIVWQAEEASAAAKAVSDAEARKVEAEASAKRSASDADARKVEAEARAKKSASDAEARKAEAWARAAAAWAAAEAKKIEIAANRDIATRPKNGWDFATELIRWFGSPSANLQSQPPQPPVNQETGMRHFTAPAHFPVRQFGPHGEVCETAGVVLYEGMTFSWTPDGHYQVQMKFSRPSLATRVWMQLRFQHSGNTAWHTITLKPIHLDPASDSNSSRSTISEPILITLDGHSPSIADGNGDLRSVVRTGTARFNWSDMSLYGKGL